MIVLSHFKEQDMIQFKHIAIAATATASLALAPTFVKGASAAAEKLHQDSLRTECNPDWGPSTQTIRGEQVKCNMAPQPNF